jgi:hypothetical protein
MIFNTIDRNRHTEVGTKNLYTAIYNSDLCQSYQPIEVILLSSVFKTLTEYFLYYQQHVRLYKTVKLQQ